MNQALNKSYPPAHKSFVKLTPVHVTQDPVLLRHGEFETAMNDVKLWYHGKVRISPSYSHA